MPPKKSKRTTPKPKSKSKISPPEKQFGVVLAKTAQPKRKTGSPTGSLSLSKCALKYAIALSDPFNPAARGACIPVGSAATHKCQAVMRFDVTVGTSGYGAVLLTPSLASDLPSLYYTNSAFSGNFSTVLCPFTSSGALGAAGTPSGVSAGWASANHSMPYNAGQIVAGSGLLPTGTVAAVQGRIVSMGLRAQYTGTLMNESGVYYCYHDTGHVSLSGANVSNLGNFADINVEGVTRMPCTLTVHGVHEHELFLSSGGEVNGTAAGLANLIYPFSNGVALWNNANYGGGTSYTAAVAASSTGTYMLPVGVPIGVLAFSGVAGQTYHFEAVVNAEYSGMGAASNVTTTHSDPVAADHVRAAALRIPRKQLDKPNASRWELMLDGMREVWHEIKPIVIPLALEAGRTAILAAASA